MAVTEFTLDNLKNIRADIDAALSAVATKHGIKLSLGNISFSGLEFRSKVEAKILTTVQNGVSVDSSKVRFEQIAQYYGLKAEDFGMVVTISGTKYKIAGIREKGRKNVVLITPVLGGGNRICSVDAVKTAREYK